MKRKLWWVGLFIDNVDVNPQLKYLHDNDTKGPLVGSGQPRLLAVPALAATLWTTASSILLLREPHKVTALLAAGRSTRAPHLG